MEHPARSLSRLVAHGAVGWAMCAASMLALLQLTSATLAFALHGIVVPCIFSAVSVHYFRARGSREPVTTAALFTLLVAVLDLIVVSGLMLRSLSMWTSLTGTWLPLVLVFVATWGTGSIQAMLPVREPAHGGLRA